MNLHELIDRLHKEHTLTKEELSHLLKNGTKKAHLILPLLPEKKL